MGVKKGETYVIKAQKGIKDYYTKRKIDVDGTFVILTTIMNKRIVEQEFFTIEGWNQYYSEKSQEKALNMIKNGLIHLDRFVPEVSNILKGGNQQDGESNEEDSEQTVESGSSKQEGREEGSEQGGKDKEGSKTKKKEHLKRH